MIVEIKIIMEKSVKNLENLLGIVENTLNYNYRIQLRRQLERETEELNYINQTYFYEQ